MKIRVPLLAGAASFFTTSSTATPDKPILKHLEIYVTRMEERGLQALVALEDSRIGVVPSPVLLSPEAEMTGCPRNGLKPDRFQ